RPIVCNATVSIAPDSLLPVTSSTSLIISGNAAPTRIGIAAPTDPNYNASQLIVRVTGLPSDGAVLLSDGLTAISDGQTLTVSQLTGLMFKPSVGSFGTSSTFTYTVTDPAGLSSPGEATLTIA